MNCHCNTERHDPNCHIDHTLSVLEADMAFPQSNPNPMNSRCGEEGCDCGYVIEKQTEALKQALAIMEQFREPRIGRYWLPNWLAGARYAIHLAEEGQR